jgi:outer membrane protein OmpA-like peptidoglycan-associated protein
MVKPSAESAPTGDRAMTSPASCQARFWLIGLWGILSLAGVPAMAAEAPVVAEQLRAAEIQVDVMKQAVVEALGARAQAEAKLEMLRQDDAAEIEALAASQKASEARILALIAELGAAKGEIMALSDQVERLSADGVGFQRAALETTADDAPTASRSTGFISPATTAPNEFQVGEIHFNPGSADLTPGGRRKAREAAERIKSMEVAEVRVVGYTDSAGGADLNKHLSLRRADSIAELFAEVGISRDIIRIDGRGEQGGPEVTEDQISEPLNRCASINVVMASPK